LPEHASILCYTYIVFLVKNSLQIPFTRVVFSVPPSKWPMRPSCSLLLFFPFFFFPCLSFLVPVIDISSECRAVAKLFCSPPTVSFLWISAGDRYLCCYGFEKERQERRTCHLEGGKIDKFEYKIHVCVFCDIFLVIFVLR